MTATYIEWDRYENLCIRDIAPKWYKRVAEFMLENNFKKNRIYNILHIPEEEGSDDDYLFFVNHVLRNECSIVAIDEETNTIRAVALLKWMTKAWRSWIEILELVRASKFRLILNLWYSITVDYHNQNADASTDSLHIFEYYIDEELLGEADFMEKFFDVICQVGRHMKMPCVTAITLSKLEKRRLLSVKFVKLCHLIFAMYLTPQRTRPFDILRDHGEQSGWMFEKKLEPLTPYDEINLNDDKNEATQSQHKAAEVPAKVTEKENPE